ncbi:hypothetical protein TcasGA2_TC034862 [Tribolium castaneum]|uniref:Uncharacterized protein n=1 Tax=Tribolium castaneum TaxID=7070 RepID=A0A139WCB3_TRICA|nr:hypothetical protein TcasGA2_TC034862 [Tribolium castaneum]
MSNREEHYCTKYNMMEKIYSLQGYDFVPFHIIYIGKKHFTAFWKINFLDRMIFNVKECISRALCKSSTWGNP